MSKNKKYSVHPCGTDADIMELSGQELIEKVCDIHDLSPVNSVSDLETFIGLLNAEGEANVTDFLTSNPGAIEAILEWLADQVTSEQRDNLENEVACHPDECPDDDDPPTPSSSADSGWQHLDLEETIRSNKIVRQ